jgi:hypothetical protein
MMQNQNQTQPSSDTKSPSRAILLAAQELPVLFEDPEAVVLAVCEVFVDDEAADTAIDGYADCVGNGFPSNASTINFTESFIYGVPGVSYDRWGTNDVPLLQTYQNQLSTCRALDGSTHRISGSAILPQSGLKYRPQWR